MASKIPVGATIAHAYRFAFHNFLKVAGVMWLPLAAQFLLSQLMIQRMLLVMTAIQGGDPSALHDAGLIALLYPLVLILFTSQFVAVTQLALDQRSVPPWLHFPLGRPVWRLVGAMLLAVLVLAVIALIFFAAGAVIILLLRAAAAAPAMAGLVASLLFLAGYCGMILIAFRFLFLLAPVTLAEGRIDLLRGWQLTYGNFWRMFLITLAIILPVIILEYGAILGAAGLPPMPHAGESRQAWEAARLAWNLRMIGMTAHYWFVTLPLFAVLMVFWFGAGCSAQVFAWRRLRDGSAPVSGDALP